MPKPYTFIAYETRRSLNSSTHKKKVKIMKAKQEIENVIETRTLLNLSKHNWLGLVGMTKKCLPLLVVVAVAVAGSTLLGGSLWWWLAGAFVGKLAARLLLTIALAVILYFLIYILIYASIIGGILWILIG